MPELPDVESFNRLISDRCRGRTITQALVSDAGILQGISPNALEERLKGEQIRSSTRHGKHLFILLRAATLAMHFGMNGSLQFVRREEAEPPYTRLRLDLADGDGLAYLNPRRLGGLTPSRTWRAVAEKALGVVADAAAADSWDRQHLFDEILFQARIHPDTAVRHIRDENRRAPVPGNSPDASDGNRLWRRLRAERRTPAKKFSATRTAPRRSLLEVRHPVGHCQTCGAHQL
jgi:formamidopyrimidine-DNA glycosylase